MWPPSTPNIAAIFFSFTVCEISLALATLIILFGFRETTESKMSICMLAIEYGFLIPPSLNTENI